MKNTPLVSVIIPTYKRSDFLDEAILSVVNQTYKNLEIIVCDDNAEFLDSRRNVKNIVSKYPQVKLIQNAENLGGSGNRNVGIQHANGELISFLDDDDVYDEMRIDKVVNCYLANKNKTIGIIYTHCFFTDEHLHILGEYAINPEKNVLFQHMRGCLCATSQWTVPKSVFTHVGGFEITPSKQDSIMLLKILGEGYEALCIPEKLSYYRGHKRGKISGTNERHIIGELNYLKWLHKYFDKLQPTQQKIVDSYAQKRLLVDYSGMGKRKEALSCIKKIVKYEGYRGLNIYCILYLIASPQFYKRIYHKFVGGGNKTALYGKYSNHVINAICETNNNFTYALNAQEIHKDKVLVSILTPTYNRANLLPRLFQSLIKQTSFDFEWLIVDDGSTDNTEAVVREWIQEAQFPIRYFKQENGGKHRAINRGLREACGELFFIVDSDDYLTADAIETINKRCESIKGDDSFCGVCLLKVDKDLNKIGSDFPYETLDCSCLDFRYKYCVSGDMAEIVRTDFFRRFPFPEIEDERFCPEALVWNRIGSQYKFRYANDKVYVCEYLEDGLTAKITKIRMQSPVASCMCYSEQASMPVPLKIKLKSAINYWRFWFCPSKNKKPSISWYWWWVMPLGLIMHIKDMRIK